MTSPSRHILALPVAWRGGPCPGYQRDEDGFPCCPLGYEPPEDQSWFEYCDMCRMGAEDAEERRGAMEREESGDSDD